MQSVRSAISSHYVRNRLWRRRAECRIHATGSGEVSMPVVDKRESQRVYMRGLPGGGFVSIEVRPVRTMLGQRRYVGEVIVEQRVEIERRQGHVPPAVAHAEADTVAAVVHE